MFFKNKGSNNLVFILSLFLIVLMIFYVLFNLINRCIARYNKSSLSTSLGYSVIEGMDNAALEAQIAVLESQIRIATTTKSSAQDRYTTALTERDSANTALETATLRATSALESLKETERLLEEASTNLTEKETKLTLLQEQLSGESV